MGTNNSANSVAQISSDYTSTASSSYEQSLTLEAQNGPIPLLEKILSEKIKIDPTQQLISRGIVTNFLEELTKILKDICPVFKLCFQKIYYTGSSYEDLRIKSADEYDINLILKFPFKTHEREIEYISGIKAFAKYKLKDDADTSSENAALVHKKFFKDNYLIPLEIEKWMQSIIIKAINSKKIVVGNVLQITDSKSGPARTVKLKTAHNYEIDIDLVPVVEFLGGEWPKFARRTAVEKFYVSTEEQNWFLVPKEYKGRNVTDVERARLMRIHIPNVEKKVLHNIGCAKPVVKLLKLLRDKQDWKALASYYLKTVVMYRVEENQSQEYWKKNKMPERFMEVLKSLCACVKQKNLPSFFYQDYNLIQVLSDNSLQAENLSYRLIKIINTLDKDFSKITDFL